MGGNLKLIDCPKCGFKHLCPQPTKQEIDKFYKSEYYQQEKTNLLDFQKEKNEQKWASLAWNDRLEMFERYVKADIKKLLDVGCGNGFFLKFMKDNGWQVTGIEPSPIAHKHAKSLGLKVLQMTVGEFSQKSQSARYDAINLKNLLEHVPNPKEVLRICKVLLDRNHGIICVQVPNEFNPLQLQAERILEKPRYWITIPDHINYFDFESLERLIQSTGFQVIHRTTDFPMELFLLMDENYKNDDKLGSECHQKRMSLEITLPDKLRREIYTKLAILGIGRNCIVYAKTK